MKIYSTIIVLSLILILGTASCSKQREHYSDTQISLDILNASDGNLTFRIKCDSEADVSKYAFLLCDSAQDISAKEIYQKGIRSVPKQQYIIPDLESDREYVLYATALISNSLTYPDSISFKTIQENLIDANLNIDVINITDGFIEFNLTYDSEAHPSLYAFLAEERGLNLSATEIYNKGTKCTPKPNLTLSFDSDKKYSLYATIVIPDNSATSENPSVITYATPVRFDLEF